MATKQIKQPGPDHPITIEASPSRVVVTVAGRVVADTWNALTLREAGHDPVQYISAEDVDMSLLHTYCPYKGDCSYYSVPIGGQAENAVWTYVAPFSAVEAIKGRLAFYPGRVDRIEETEAA
jgi:uncharacterized protein (DUF427 family)